MDHVVDRLEGQIRINRSAPVADEQREVMNLARFTGFENQSNAVAVAFANQVMVEAADSQQCRDGRALGAESAVGQDQNIDPVVNRFGSCLEQVFQGLLESLGALVHLVKDGERDRLVARLIDAFELGQFFVSQHRRLQLDEVATLR